MGADVSDMFNLDRFVNAQNTKYETVCLELKAGRKESHWMWYIFPQIKGLGNSYNTRFFAISSLEEAKAYLAHPILGTRLVECTKQVNKVENRSIYSILGAVDSIKFRSSMTLFFHATYENECFDEALKKYFNGEFDHLTLKLIST
jgi:uncharacterized protein (DUF1810 family)